jgi:fructokinase
MCVKDIAINHIAKENMEAMLKFSNAVAALTTINKGAISALPDLETVMNFIKVN